ncbi:hypothetical protein KP509_11G081800 [Ceratopteris richardii]|uniref:Uncharacterized protein n=1 Tax=Ceratopteris richardii TaxID=49495 RepID=A0A8T2TXF0_CERRI|nr:hypothetical protein KP509_11G081800 [Ceratopteris richardii]KAH7426024.1 hypothetical protein KP509_11G081800 [Ceratopteris richardii]KAH7426025.1 hypothetical protein KP509_11G081800 [Ceratopteris richardii]
MDSSMSETTFLSSTTSSQQDDPQNSYNQSALVPSAHERYESGRAIEADMGADDRQVLLAITVEIHDGHTGTISVHEGDSAEDVATKFCKDHAISEQYITPLTEHIVRELHISGLDDKILDHGTTISKADEGRPQSSKGESRGEDLSPNSVSQRNKRTHSLFERTNPKLCNHKLCSLKTLMQQELPKVKTRKPTGHHVLPSFASLAKSQKVESLLEKKLEAQRSSQLSPKSKAVYTRLYVEFLKQKQRMEEERKACLEQYHERLERDKPTYTKRTKRIMSIRGRAAKQFKNYGELLYREGLNKGVERKRLAEQKQLEDECHELESITAKPEISKYAKQLKRPHKFWERLSTDDSKHHLRELQNESLEMKLMECTFRPRINKNFFLDQEANSSNRFNQLFWDAESRRRRQAEYMQWYPEGVTFRPMINPHWASGSALYSGKGKGNVFNRLLQYASKLADKKQKWQDNEQKPVDPTTGKELFRPQTGRKPYLERNTDAVPIGDFLYQLKFALDKKKHALMDRNIQKAKELANCQYVSSNSSKILESIKSRSIQEIFDYLDVDQDGYIDLTNADTKDLSNEVMEDLEYVKELGTGFEKQLSFEKFSTLMIEIQKKKKHGLHSVFRHCKKHQEIEKLPFNLKLDERSCQLASGRRKPGDRQHWYQLILSDWEKQQAKVEALRKEKENQELAECTFKPSLHKNDCRKPARFIHGGPINGTLSSPQSTVVEKEQQEIHGFIFQEAKMGGHDYFVSW